MTIDNQHVYIFVTSVLLPAIIAAINRPHWSPLLKSSVAILCIVGAALAWVTVSGQYSPAHIAETLRTMVVTSVAFYQLVYKPTGLKDSIESGVNGGKPTDAGPVAEVKP